MAVQVYINTCHVPNKKPPRNLISKRLFSITYLVDVTGLEPATPTMSRMFHVAYIALNYINFAKKNNYKNQKIMKY